MSDSQEDFKTESTQNFSQNDDYSYDNQQTTTTTTENNGNKSSTNNHEEDDDSSSNRKLFVGGLSWETTDDDLKSYFETWGKVSNCLIKVDKMTGNSRGFGFVTFENEESINKVLEAGEHRLKNKKIDPKPAKPTKQPIKKIFVGGLSPDVTEDQIKEYFGQFGTVESVDLPFDTAKGKRKPYVFLSFTTEDAAKSAIANEKQDVCGSKVDVRMAVPKEQVAKNKRGGADYYSYEYPYGGPYSYDPNSYYSGYYSGYPYGYSYPMPPQPYVAPRGGGKARGRGGSSANYHPYARPQ